jgi:hypothetical protein
VGGAEEAMGTATGVGEQSLVSEPVAGEELVDGQAS